jgi:hypothetical protein
MLVRDVVDLLGKTSYEIRGTSSGKLYYRSFTGMRKNLDRYLSNKVTKLYSKKDKYGNPIVGIWMVDK